MDIRIEVTGGLADPEVQDLLRVLRYADSRDETAAPEAPAAGHAGHVRAARAVAQAVEVAPEAPSADDLRQAGKRAIDAGRHDDVARIVETHGVSNLAQVAEDDRAAVLAELEALA